jgi:hypothetical protein
MARKTKGVNRGTAAAVAVAAVLAAVLAAAYAPGAYQALTQALGGQGGEAGESDGWSYEVDPGWSYQAGEAFDLTGRYYEEREDAKGWHGGDMWSFEDALPWYGTMRVTASRPVWYPSAEAAQFPYIAGPSSGWGVVVVTLHIENVDARCRESVRDSAGADSFLLTMFELAQTTGGSLAVESYADLLDIDAPRVEGLVYQSDKASGYAWATQGASVDVRLGYVVFGRGDKDESHNSDASYYLVVNPMGKTHDTSGLPVVELGPARDATEGSAS